LTSQWKALWRHILQVKYCRCSHLVRRPRNAVITHCVTIAAKILLVYPKLLKCHVKFHLTCTSCHLIYCISCTKCGLLDKSEKLEDFWGQGLVNIDVLSLVTMPTNLLPDILKCHGNHRVSDKKIRALCPICRGVARIFGQGGPAKTQVGPSRQWLETKSSRKAFCAVLGKINCRHMWFLTEPALKIHW
jgi:hypothetical protein